MEEPIQTQTKKEDTIQLSKSGLWQIISGVLFVLLIVSLFTSGFGFGKNSVTGGTVANNPPTAGGNNVPNVPTGIVDVSADDDPVLGKKDAKVTIIEFSDFQCPFCARFHEQAYTQIKTDYIDTGKAKLVYRDFPLSSIHPMAEKGAEAAGCAYDQGKFWEYHDVLFNKQTEWTSGASEADNVVKLKQYAKDLSLDTNKFDKCLDDGKYKAEVQKDFQDGAQAGVQGTPSFFINGKQISGAQPFAAFKAVIDPEIK